MRRTWALGALALLVAAPASAGPAAWTSSTKLTGAGEVNSKVGGANGQFGAAVAVSSDGKTLVVGGNSDNGGRGAVWIFGRAGAGWKQLAKLIPRGTPGAPAFGQSVAISGDGTTILVGGPKDVVYYGGVWVFTRSGAGWKQQAKLVSGRPGADLSHGFGSSVALSADGNTALVGAPLYGERVGAAFAFRRTGSTWTKLGKVITGKGGRGSPGFGSTVALSADAGTAVVGGPNEGGLATRARGAVWFFGLSSSGWTPEGGRVTPADAPVGSQFGCSAALSANGATALVGGCRAGASRGAAWTYVRSLRVWKQAAKLTPPAQGIAGFGSSVSLSRTAGTALVGAPYVGSGNGAAWVFRSTGDAWRLQAELTATNATPVSGFGYSAGLSGDGATALVGGPGDRQGAGAAWVRTH